MKTDPILYRSDGTQEVVMPANKKIFTEPELKTLIGGAPAKIFISACKIIVVNTDGASDGSLLNVRATAIVQSNGNIGEPVYGNALVCLSKFIQ
ncbi:MAG: hypothetical protein LBS01_10440 [Prevotellaceae bacterium]|jgi:hypothetical protein|nr:hypothetical protein [Prevotellaceae bacterium]